MDCKPSPGCGDCDGDCDELSASIYPGAPEVCNGYDDNCNGMADEGVRPTCGTGWCQRYAATCTRTCVPGTPLVETCNAYDDDCAGVIDNGTDDELCGGSGMTCVNGRCLSATGGGASGGVSGSGGAQGRGGASGSPDASSTIGVDRGPSRSGGGDKSGQGSGCALAGSSAVAGTPH